MLKSDSSDHAERELLIGMNGWIMKLAPLTLTQAGSSPKKQTEQAGARGRCRPAFLWHLVRSTPTICGDLSTQQLPAGSGGPSRPTSIWLHPNWEATRCLRH